MRLVWRGGRGRGGRGVGLFDEAEMAELQEVQGLFL